MGVQEEVLRFRTESQGVERLQALQNLLDGVGDAAGEAAAKFGAGTTELAEYNAEMLDITNGSRQARQAIVDTQREIRDAAAAERKAAREAADEVARAKRDETKARRDAAREAQQASRDSAREEREAAAAERKATRDAADAVAAAKRDETKARRDAAREAQQADRATARSAREAATAERQAEATRASAASAARVRIQAVGYALQDFLTANGGLAQQLNSVSNNIPQIVGVTSKWGTALSVAVPLLTALTPAVVRFYEALSGDGALEKGLDDVTKLEERIKGLTDKKHKVAVDYADLRKAKEELDAIQTALHAVDAVKKSRGAYQAESGQAVANVLAQAPGGADAVYKQLRGQMVEERKADDPALADARKLVADRLDKVLATQRDINAGRYAGDMDSGVEALRHAKDDLKSAREAERLAGSNIDRQGGSADVALGKIIEDAQNGVGAKQTAAQAELARRLAQAGRVDLAEGVRASSPEQLQANDEADDALEESVTTQKEGRKNVNAKNRKKSQEADDWDDFMAELKEIEGADQKRKGEARKADDAKLDERARQVAASTDVDENAAAEAGRLRRQGGYYDPARDRVVPLNAQQQQNYLGRRAANYLRGAGLGADEANALGSRFAGKALENYDQAEAARKLGENAQKNLGVSQQTLKNQQGLAAVADAQQGQLDQLRDTTAQIGREIGKVLAKSRTRQNRFN